MNLITLDFETFYSDEYTLSKMTTEEYVRDPRFEAHGCAFRGLRDFSGNEIPTFWAKQDDLHHVFQSYDFSQFGVLAHHAQFDGLILSHHYGIRPKFWFDTLSMARLLLGNHLSVGLDSLAKHFGLAAKTVPYNLFKGKHWNELPPAVQQQVGDGACHDVELAWQLFQTLAKNFPREEFQVIDTVIRMFTDPVLQADSEILAQVWESEAVKKQTRLEQLGVTAADLQSADRFAALLRECGVEPETKQGKNGSIYAFAKTDDFMRDCQEHPDERVQALAEARLGVKSTLMQTRAATLGWMARRGPLPVYLNYAGAGTLRVSGGDGANWLNFKRGSAIRRSILAPEGCLLAPIDSSQIECRVLNYLAGQEDVIENFRTGKDPYVGLATAFYGEQIYKPAKDDPRREEMEMKRGAGKQGELMCFGPHTLVLTNRGVKPIIAIELTDKLWDGYGWVTHAGLVYRGEKQVIEPLGGLKLTPDHKILCENSWIEAQTLLNELTQSRALATASESLSLRAMWSLLKGAFDHFWHNARVERQSTASIRTIFLQDDRPVAVIARGKWPAFGAKNIWATLMSVRTTTIGLDSSGVFRQSTIDAKSDQNIMPQPITEGAEFEFTVLGERESPAKENFWHILSLCRAGIIRPYQLIASTIKMATVRVICASLTQPYKQETDADFETSKKKLPTFDIAFAGPRNRFTVVTAAGPLIVHNCGYGAAGPKFKATAKAGLYGPPIDISLEDANRFVFIYRETHPKICARNIGYWAQAGRALSRLAGGPPMEWGPLTVKDHRIYLPNGCPLIYDTLEYYKPAPEEAHLYKEFEQDGFWRIKTRHGWKTMWGSKLVQNICEAVSRVIVSQAMNRITAMGYRVLNWPYDELLCLIPKDGREQEHFARCLAEMKKPVVWLPGLPLDAEGSLGDRYSK